MVGTDCLRQMLDKLLVAVESDTLKLDVTRVSGFMQKVRADL